MCEQIVHHWGGASVLAHRFKSTCVPRVTKICATFSFLGETSERKTFLNCLFHLGAKTLLWLRGYLNYDLIYRSTVDLNTVCKKMGFPLGINLLLRKKTSKLLTQIPWYSANFYIPWPVQIASGLFPLSLSLVGNKFTAWRAYWTNGLKENPNVYYILQ